MHLHRVYWTHMARRMRYLCLQATRYPPQPPLSILCPAPTRPQLTARVPMFSWGIRKTIAVMSQISTGMMVYMEWAALLPTHANTRCPLHKSHSTPIPTQKSGRFLLKRWTIHHGHILSRRSGAEWPSSGLNWKERRICWKRCLTKSFLL